MLRHIVLIRFKPEVDAEAVRELERGFHRLAELDEVSAMHFGADLRLTEGNFDYAMSADFESEADWLAYQQHPEHVTFAQCFKDMAEAACRVQFQPTPED